MIIHSTGPRVILKKVEKPKEIKKEQLKSEIKSYKVVQVEQKKEQPETDSLIEVEEAVKEKVLLSEEELLEEILKGEV